MQNSSEAFPFSLFGLVWCNIDAMCLNASLPSVVQKFGRQVLNEGLDIRGSSEVPAAARTTAPEIEELQERRKRVRWETFAKLPATQLIPGHVAHFLSKRFKGWSLFEIRKHFTVVKLAEERWPFCMGWTSDAAVHRVWSPRNDVEEITDQPSASGDEDIRTLVVWKVKCCWVPLCIVRVRQFELPVAQDKDLCRGVYAGYVGDVL